MATEEKWYFTKEQLENTPSRQCAIDSYKELFYRQQAANFIQDMGQRLRVSQLCINTATVYMHRFYVFHSFTQFPWHSTAAAALFLSAKVEEQPRKLEHVIRVHNVCKNTQDTAIDVHSERYLTQSQDLVFNENILLQTLGFDVAIDHPHAHVVRCCHLVRASKDLAQTSYFMASTSLHLTTMCLQYKPTVVACFCIHLVCKWSNWEIPLSNEKKEWFYYVDPSVTSELLAQLTDEFLVIFDKCPPRLKEKIMAIYRNTGHVSSPFETEARKMHPSSKSKDPHHRAHHHDKPNADDPHKHRSRPPHDGSSSGGSSSSQQQRDYREKKDSERIAQHAGGKAVAPHSSSSSSKPNIPHGHHRPLIDPKIKQQHSRPLSAGHPPLSDPHRDILREAARDIGIRDSHSRDPSRVSSDKLDKDLQVRSDKDVEKRAYAVKPPTGSDANNLQPSSDHPNYSGDKRLDTSRSRLVNDPNKMLQQHPTHNSSSRRHEEQKSQNDVRKHMNAGWYDKNNMHMKQQMANSTSQKMKSPFTPDTPKSVPKKIEQHNGNSNGGFSLPLFDEPKSIDIKDEFPYQAPVKKPSMFSPEKTPPRKTPMVKPPNIPTPISPIESLNKHPRTSSTSSEPELRPVMKKIDHVEGFENILRDSTIGIKHHVENQAQELKPPDVIATPMLNSSIGSVPLSQPIINGIETNPTLISNLLKEVPSVPHLPTIVQTMQEEISSVVSEVIKDKEHHHKERKKKNKEKHKHKDKDKNKEEKEKKKKHKDKDKDKHKSKRDKESKQDDAVTAQPIKITISKDKIQPPETQSVGLKIKIPKDRIKTDGIGESSAPAPGIKIKIPKDVISNMGSDNKKREREKSSPNDGPPNKVSKSSFSRQHGDKQNGRNSYGKVAHMGDGDTSMHRLAESKYINKGAST